MKKGRHRRFEEARKLKQMGPESLLDLPDTTRADNGGDDEDEDDEYARIAERYGVEFDDDEDDDED